MAFEVSIKVHDLKKFKSDRALALFLHIKSNCNEMGFTFIHNKTLSTLLDKSERRIKEVLVELQEQNLIIVKHDVKQNDIYDKNYHRVIWIKSSWLDYQDSIRQERSMRAVKTPETDYREFVQHIRTMPNFPFHIKHLGGEVKEYRVNPNDGNLWEYSGLTPCPMKKHEAKKVFDILFANRHDVIKNPTQMFLEHLTEDQKRITDLLTELAILKKV